MIGAVLSLSDLFDAVPSDEKVYLYDHDGIEKDKPNLCLYQKLSERYTLWVDGGPRTSGDVVDMLMTGITTLTVRQTVWRSIDLSTIKELTENEVFLFAGIFNNTVISPSTEQLGQEAGVVLFSSDAQMDSRRYQHLLHTGKKGYKVFVYDGSLDHFKYWKNKDITGLITDLPYWKKVKGNGL